MIEDFLRKADEHIGQEQWQAAVDLLTKAYELDENNLEVLEKRADMYHKLNRLADSVNDFNRYLRINPNNEELLARKELVQTILKNSQLDIYGCTNTHLDPWN
jgi:tetratricopeptide (TPR) repeat protein